MLQATQNHELRELERQDPTLSSRIKEAFARAKKNGHERYAFVELEDGDVLRIKRLNADRIEPLEEETSKKTGSILNRVASFLTLGF